ncbi:MAG TPA: ABC transporter substrate-binding protein [Bacilli bacterium]|nr:ABC transporter substrate-binding protein [Bacilli bacterium]
MKKKLLLLVTGILLVIGLIACGGEKPTTTTVNDSEKKEENKEVNKELPQGITDDEILIGHLGPQTGPTAIYDLVRKGIDAHFNYVNENGGVNGRKLKLIAYDDQYQPAKSVQLVKRLVEEDKVYALLGNIGTSNIGATKDYLVEKGIPLILMSTGAKQFVDPPIETFMGSGLMNYRVEARILLDYAINELGVKKIAISYQNDDFGKEGYEEVKLAIANYPGVEIIEEVTFLPKDTEFSSQAEKLKNAQPDAVFNFGSPSPIANLKKAMYKIGLTEPAFIVNSVGANDNNLFNLAGEDVWEGTYSGAVYPMPELVPDDKVMQLFVERFSKDYPGDSTSGFSQIGWAEAQVLVEALKRAGDNPAWDNFLETFYSFDNWDGSIYAGVTLSKENHFALTTMFITQAKDRKIQPITDPISFDPKTGEVNY